MSIDGEKLRLIRQALGWQQKELADLLNLLQPHLSEMEAGVRPVPDHVTSTLHFLTGFSPKFFEQPVVADVPSGSDLWYRKPKNKYRKSDMTQAYCQLVFDVFEPLTKALKPRVPRLSRLTDCTPEDAALHVRNALGVRPDAPIENIANLAENAGVRLVGIGRPLLEPNATSPQVASIVREPDVDDFDGFSFWSKDNVPVIFVRTDIPADRYSWAIGHDLIHLVMHSSYHGSIKNAEMECQAGTRELKLPARVLRESFGQAHSITRLSSLASRWNVSLKSMIWRAAEIGILTEANKRYYLSIVNRGSGDTVQVGMQKPRFYRQMSELLFGKPIDLTLMTRATGASRQFLRAVLEAHSGRPEDLEDPVKSSSSNEPPQLSEQSPNALDLTAFGSGLDRP